MINIRDRFIQLELYSEVLCKVKPKRIDYDIALGDIFKDLKIDENYNAFYGGDYLYYKSDTQPACVAQYDKRTLVLYVRSEIEEALQECGLTSAQIEMQILRMANKYLNLSRIRDVRFFIFTA